MLTRILLVLLDHLGQQAEVLKEIVLVLVLGIDFQDADDTVVTGINKIVKLWTILKSDHTIDNVLLQDLVRVATDLIKALISLVALFFSFKIILVIIRVLSIHWTIKILSCIFAAIDRTWGVSRCSSIVHISRLLLLSGIDLLGATAWHRVEFDEATHDSTTGLLLLDRLVIVGRSGCFGGLALLSTILLLFELDVNEDSHAMNHVVLLLDDQVDFPD